MIKNVSCTLHKCKAILDHEYKENKVQIYLLYIALQQLQSMNIMNRIQNLHEIDVKTKQYMPTLYLLVLFMRISFAICIANNYR